MTFSHQELRKHPRYLVEQGNTVSVDIWLDDHQLNSLTGLVVNSSLGGSELVIVTEYSFDTEQKIKIRFPELGDFTARVVWCKLLDTHIYEMGIEYLED